MKHKYINVKRGFSMDPVYKLQCTREWVSLSGLGSVKPVSVDTNVTCLGCLQILIPIQKARLAIMERNYQQSLPPEPTQGEVQTHAEGCA